MSATNNFGLKRSELDAATKRCIRQRCGFGCVICGISIYDYEHFDPEFKNATSHTSAGITLLCPNHHRLKTNGLIDLKTLISANANPKSKLQGFSSAAYGFGAEPMKILIGGSTFIDVPCLIQIGEHQVLSVAPPEEAGGPFRLSGTFTDGAGQTILRIEDNEFKVAAENFDVEATGNKVVIRQALGELSLSLVANPPHDLIVEKINMQFLGAKIEGDANELVVTSADGKITSAMQGCVIEGCGAGIVL